MEHRALLDAAAEESQEALRDDVCTQTYAVEHQQLRLAAIESKFAALDSRLGEHESSISKQLEDLESRLMPKIGEDHKRLAEDIGEVASRLSQHLSDAKLLAQRVEDLSQERDDDKAAVRRQWTDHASKLELRFESKFEDLQQLLNQSSNGSSLRQSLNTPLGLVATAVEPAVAKMRKDDEVQSLAFKFEALQARVSVLEATWISDRYPTKHAGEMRGTFGRDVPVSELCRQLQCSTRAAALREQLQIASDVAELQKELSPEQAVRCEVPVHFAGSSTGVEKLPVDVSSAIHGCWKHVENQNAELEDSLLGFSSSSFAARRGRDGSTRNARMPGRGFDRGTSASPDTSRANESNMFSFEAGKYEASEARNADSSLPEACEHRLARGSRCPTSEVRQQ